jgi:hypothetical protein
MEGGYSQTKNPIRIIDTHGYTQEDTLAVNIMFYASEKLRTRTGSIAMFEDVPTYTLVWSLGPYTVGNFMGLFLVLRLF